MRDFTKKYFHLNSSAVYNSSAKIENEEVTVDVMKQCLEENQELSLYRKDITTEDLEVKETQELAENKEEKSKEKNENNNESQDTSIVKVTNPKLLTLKDMPTRRLSETRGQFMCRLALQIKKCDNWYMTKEDMQSDTSYSDLMSGDDADISDKVAEDSSVK